MSGGDVFQFAATQQLSSNQTPAPDNENSSDSDNDQDDDGMSVATASTAGRREPSFASANFATILPEYRNRGQDAVKMAFQPGSFSSIRDLPDTLSHTSVEHALFDKAATNLHSTPVPVATRKMGYKNLFSQFQYMPDTYDIKKELDAQEAREAREKRLRIGKGKEFAHAGIIEKKLPAEDQFLHENSLFANDERLKNKLKWQSDPIERFQEKLTRERLEEVSKRVNPAFCPGGVDPRLDPSMPSRSLLPDVLRNVKSAIASDWPDTTLRCFEENSMLVVEFSGVDPDDSYGVTAYMNLFHKKNPVAVRFKLKKQALAWNQVSESEGGGEDSNTKTIRFGLIPPWVRGAELGVIWKEVRGNAAGRLEYE